MNIRIDLEFDGTAYFGWQNQPNRPTVQGCLEQALKKLYGAPVAAVGAGRTDTGVSAVDYTANFHPPRALEMRAVRAALNQLLPDDIRVKRARPVTEGFNARFSAVSKLYRYTIVFAPTPILRRQVWLLTYAIDSELMAKGARLFLGVHDFAPFCRLSKMGTVPFSAPLHRAEKRGCPRFSTSDTEHHCDVIRVAVRRRRSATTGLMLLQIEFRADRFLYKMVRRMVGALVDVGRGKFSLDDLRQAVETVPAVQFQTAPAAGLVLVKVSY